MAQNRHSKHLTLGTAHAACLCGEDHTIYTMHTQGVTLEFPVINCMYPTFCGPFSVRDPRFVHLSMS